MAFIGNFICTSFKKELMNAEHDLDTHTIKMALYDSSASLDASTTAYSTTNEVTGTGYTAGGATMTGASLSTDGTVAYVDFDDVSWASSTITARGALVYNDTHASNAAIAVLDFGGDKVSQNTTFTVSLPAGAAATAIIRIE